MLKNIAKLVLRKIGCSTRFLSKKNRLTDTGKKLIEKSPLDADLHFNYALRASKINMPFLAYGQLKTAEYLGTSSSQIAQYAESFFKAIPNLEVMDHNQYFRFKTLTCEIIERANDRNISILDIGGGEGKLAAFLPKNYRYCLVEPEVNGISGINLPFEDHSFDLVVSCHVLEHIPIADRESFLDQLISKAKCGVILLNPFYIEGTHEKEGLELVIELTNALWAKEHLECSLPKLEDIKAYAEKNELTMCYKANGSLTTTLAYVFADYFATKVTSLDEWNKVNKFFNTKFSNILNSEDYPNAYLIYLSKNKI